VEAANLRKENCYTVDTLYLLVFMWTVVHSVRLLCNTLYPNLNSTQYGLTTIVLRLQNKGNFNIAVVFLGLELAIKATEW